MKACIIVVILFLFAATPLFSQIKLSDLSGEWTTCNKDGLYYKSDTIVMYQDANYAVNADCCYYVNWTIRNKKNIKIEDAFLCTEPGRLSSFEEKETLKLRRRANQQLIIIKRGNTEIGKFLVVNLKEQRVNRYPHYIKMLTLRRL